MCGCRAQSQMAVGDINNFCCSLSAQPPLLLRALSPRYRLCASLTLSRSQQRGWLSALRQHYDSTTGAYRSFGDGGALTLPQVCARPCPCLASPAGKVTGARYVGRPAAREPAIQHHGRPRAIILSESRVLQPSAWPPLSRRPRRADQTSARADDG